MARVLAAMSGGVDSSVSAAMLHEQGHEVVGVAMRLVQDHPATGGRRRGTCCSHDDFEDARRVAERFDFPFYVIDLRADFGRRVIDNFIGEYRAGRTPNPCARCNGEIKFDRLWQRARAIKADFIATGHYARITQIGGGYFQLRRAADPDRDQSYFLFALGQEQLARTLFPLGEMTKAQVRASARKLGLLNADKADSQEICFVPDGDYASFIERNSASSELRRGTVVDSAGNVLGSHRGIHNFTIGQRRGLKVASRDPVYVREIRADTGEVVVGGRAELAARGLTARDVSFVNPASAGAGEAEIEVKIRSRHRALPATLKVLANSRAEVSFELPGPAVSPGQACVFYRGDEVIGGGFIERGL
jgi:tRNA-specific 2-thiouridylase